MSVLIATPMYGGQCCSSFMISTLQITHKLTADKIPWNFYSINNESLITRARNKCVHEFLKTEYEHLFFIDADIGFSPQNFLDLLEAKKDIVCGVYFCKNIDWQRLEQIRFSNFSNEQLKRSLLSPSINLIDVSKAGDIKMNELFEIKYGATGFMAIHRSVFEKLKKTTEQYNTLEDKGIYDFFPTAISKETRQYLSEDYAFCENWRNLGGKIYMAPWVELAHTGSYCYSV